MLKKIVSGISMIALAIAALVFVPSTAANAAITVDMDGKTLFFDQAGQTVNTYSSGQGGGFANDITVYRNAATSAVTGSVGIDAVITVDRSLVKTGTGTGTTGGYTYVLDAASSAVTAPPTGNTSPTAAQLLQTDVTPSAANNYITLKFQFYESGTYTGYGTGNLLTLQNLEVNSYDLDYVSGKQFTQFRSFQTYTYSSNTTLLTSNQAGGWVQFIDNTGSAGYSDTSGSYTKGRVKVKYDQLTELSIRHGVNSTNGGKFALDFGPGYAWKDTAVQSTVLYGNPNNQAPTSANNSVYFSTGTPWVFNLGNFAYSDPENNAFATVKIASLPGAGSLQQLVGATWTNVAVGDVLPVSLITNGGLRFNGSANTTFTFKVNDGSLDSPAYTMSMLVATNAQTITFANPGTKQVSATPFGSGATATSGLTVTLVSLTSGTCSVSGLTITALANGFCTIIATQAGNASYSEAPAVTQTFPISTLTGQVITFSNPGTQTLNTTINVSASASSTLSTTIISLTPSVCTIVGNTVTHVSTGTCILRASQGGNTSYAPAAPVEIQYLVNTGSLTAQTLTFAQPANQALENATVTVSATSSASLAVTFTSATPLTCTVSGTTVTMIDSGICTITANQAGNSTYASATLSRSFYILEITTLSLADGSETVAYSQTLTSFQGATGTNLWSVSPALPAGLSLNTATGIISGTPTTAQSATNYTFTVVNGGVTATRVLSITISPTVAALLSNTITWGVLPNVSLTYGPMVLAGMNSASLPITYTSNTPSVCSVTAGVVTMLDTGFCEIVASQPGDSTHEAATPVTQSFNIFKITTPSISTGTVDAPYQQPLAVVGTMGNGSWSAVNLPAGFAIDPNTGVITGSSSTPLSVAISVSFTQELGSPYNGTSVFTVPYLLNISPLGTTSNSGNKPGPVITPVNGSGQVNTPVTVVPKVWPIVPYWPGLCLIDPTKGNCKQSVTIKGQGTWLLDANGSVTFTPVQGWTGTSTVILHAWDGDGQTDDKPISVTIARRAGVRAPVSTTIGGFAPGSPVLTTSIKTAIKAFLKKYSDYKNIQCTGVTMGPTVLKTDSALASNRAANACSYALTYLKNLIKLPNKTLTELVLGSQVRRVIITLSDN